MSEYTDEHWEKITACVVARVNKLKIEKMEDSQKAIAASEAKVIEALQEKDRNKRIALNAEAKRLESQANQKLNDANAFGNQVGDVFEGLRACLDEGMLDLDEDAVDSMIKTEEGLEKKRQIDALEKALAELKG